jgi:hypothetical protein
MHKNRYKIILLLTMLVGIGLACESLSTLQQDFNETRGTAEAVATQAGKIITQAKGIATQVGDSAAIGTARALATEQGPSLIATGQAYATIAADEGYLQTAEALVTQGSGELLPTIEAAATQYLFPGSPPDDVPVFGGGDVTNLFANQSTVSYVVDTSVPELVIFYQEEMPALEWSDDSEDELIREQAAVLRFSKSDRSATVTLTTDPIIQRTVVFIAIINQ